MSAPIVPFIPADDLQELHVARALFGVFAKTARAVAAAHRGRFETTGCTASLAEAWRFDEEAAEHEAIVAEAEAVLKTVAGTVRDAYLASKAFPQPKTQKSREK